MARGKRRQREEEEDEEEEEEEIGSKRKAASHFFELEADVDSDEEGDEDESEAEEGFIDDACSDGKEDFVFRRREVIHPQTGEDEEEEDIDEFERRIEERYGRKSSYEEEEDSTEVFQQALLPTITDSRLWMVKCAVGHEREVAACLMQKQIDKSFKLQIKSVIALDHLQNYIYVEADKESHVREACKGMRNIFLNNKILMVPNKEMSDVLSVKNRETEFSKNSWVRLKTGNYKGDIAQIVNVDDIRRKVTVKLIPRIDFQALVDKIEGNKPPENSKKFCPPPRLWSATKSKALGIPVKRQRDSITGDYFDTVNGMKFKDGFLYKSVSIKSISNKVQPTPDDLEKFRGARDDNNNTETLSFSTLFQKKKYFKEGNRVVVLNGELKTIKGRVLKVDDDIVYLKPESEGLPESIAIHSKDLSKIFELGDHVKVVSGGKEGEIGTITSIKGHIVTILPDKSTNAFDVLADHVQENSEFAYSRNRNRNQDVGLVSIANFKPLPLKKRYGYGYERGEVRSVSTANFRALPPKKEHGFGRVRRDPLLNVRIKIRQGPYNGMTGIVVEVTGSKVRVELEAQMKFVYVDRSQIYEGVEVDKEGYGRESDCPRTPFRPTPRDCSATPIHEGVRTPIHEGMRTPVRSRAWNP